MPDPLTREERDAIAAFPASKIQRIPMRTLADIICTEDAQPKRKYVFSGDTQARRIANKVENARLRRRGSARG